MKDWLVPKESWMTIDAAGTKKWFDKGGLLHKRNGPAARHSDGSTEWYRHGILHREDGPAVSNSSHKEWCIGGFLHREDGPAIEWSDGSKEWYLNGARHREDGPAVEDADGVKAWYLNDHFFSEKEFYSVKKS